MLILRQLPAGAPPL